MTLLFDSVSFQYGWRSMSVLQEFSWRLPFGRTALLGPNGAGKSTLLALAANATSPTSGAIIWNNLNPAHWRRRGAYRKLVGWMPQQARAVPGFTIQDQVAYAGWLKGLSTKDARARTEIALEQTGLTEIADQRASRSSGGQLRRIGLAQVLVHDPELFLLDEPTVGLDPAQRARFRELLTAIPADRTVLVSTHQVDDLSDLFDTVAIMNAGRILFTGSIDELFAYAPNVEPAKRAESAYARLLQGHGL